MVESNKFPYVEGKDGTESEQHVHMKGLAVYWLLQRGFDLGNIEEEYTIPKESHEGRGAFLVADLYAEQDGQKVFIECECGSVTPRSVANAGRRKAKEGELVYVFQEDGIYRLTYGEKEFESSTEPITTHQFTRVSALPMLDLSAYE